ncbi:hypothetical protein [Neorhizobium sp. JUb45]|uniref:hypothetical protein n=1 Tax=Neorhizobium sp. JUb45 TaxID=2485113 RepID=UPI001051C191|nr:hypothetical protein [Neorhizobium sp. JUb45]TCR07366.1 hypothetical protein EDF70_1011340 [Neorhizobium sp. JUb45]
MTGDEPLQVAISNLGNAAEGNQAPSACAYAPHALIDLAKIGTQISQAAGQQHFDPDGNPL